MFGRMGVRGGHGGLGIAGGSHAWVLPGATLDANFSTGQSFGPAALTVSRASNKTNLFPTSASGFVYSTFLSNVAALTPGSGLSVEEARTNVLLNSTAPATQTTASLATGTYTLWVNGAGSATSSAGTATITGAGSATNGTPNVFVVTVAGTVTITVSGSLNAFQCELGAFGTSFIVTTGVSAARAADSVTFASPPTLGSSYSVFAQGIPQSPSTNATLQAIFSVDDGTANNRAPVRRNSATGNPNWSMTSNSVTQFGSDVIASAWAQGSSSKIATAYAAGDQAAAYNGGTPNVQTAASLPINSPLLRIGSSVGAAFFNGFIQRVALWPTSRITNTQLQSITT